MVRVHDFKDKQLGNAIPYGVYDLANDEGWVERRDRRATPPQFAVNSIQAGGSTSAASLPRRQTLTITADSGGSNSHRTRLWNVELQQLADQTGLSIRVCHFPPGTSKWNKAAWRPPTRER